MNSLIEISAINMVLRTSLLHLSSQVLKVLLVVVGGVVVVVVVGGVVVVGLW